MQQCIFKIVTFYEETPFSIGVRHQHFIGSCCLNLQGRNTGRGRKL